MKQDALHLHAGQIDVHQLPGLEHFLAGPPGPPFCCWARGFASRPASPPAPPVAGSLAAEYDSAALVARNRFFGGFDGFSDGSETLPAARECCSGCLARVVGLLAACGGVAAGGLRLFASAQYARCGAAIVFGRCA